MRVLLVTNSDKLAEKLAILSPELEYCAIVVDQVEPAGEILEQIALPQDLLYPLSKFKFCLDKLHYDYVLSVQDKQYSGRIQLFQKYNVPTEKLIVFAGLTGMSNFETERPLRYYREHFQEFEMFATGTSTTEAGIDIRKFKRKAINFATSSQDLYYNFQIAKSVILCGGGA